MSNKQDIAAWWAANPMTYGETHGETRYENRKLEIGSREFFERLDREFFSWNTPLHGARPFEKIFPYDNFPSGSRALEIGCGMGTMASCWARNGAIVTAVDLNPTAIEQTKRRFDLHGLEGDIHTEDANALSFPDASFDYSYSWGALHHSPDLEKSISEMMRVTRPGGGFGIMLYNRRSILQWYTIEYIEGFLHCERMFLDSLQLASRYGDGAREEGNPHTWPVTRREMTEIMQRYSSDVKIKTLGTDLDVIFRMMLPVVAKRLPVFVKKSWARRFGWSLWIYGKKE